MCLACKGQPAQNASVAATATAPAAAPLPSTQRAAAPPRAEVGLDSDPCPHICGRTRALGCKRAGECVSNCQEMSKIAACAGEMASVLRCFAHEPVAHWECNEDGEAAIKVGYCDQEQGKFVACAQKTATAPAAPQPTAL